MIPAVDLLPECSTAYVRTYTKAAFDAALATPASDSDAPGFLYCHVITNPGGSKEWKWGRSNDPQRRLEEWRKQCFASEIELLASVRTVHAKKLGAPF